MFLMDAITETAAIPNADVLPGEIPRGLNGKLKRTGDVTVALLLLLFTFPLMAVIALIIKLQDGGPVFFRHVRRGHGGRHFTLLKFRTMRLDADERLRRLLAECPASKREWETISKLSKDPRVTPIGRFLRRSSLDELPQLFNILKGEMSVVGPRPIIDEEFQRYGIFATAYAAARPGLTGLWQVSGRNETCFEERILLDTTYVRDWTLAKDVIILFRTIPAVITGRGAY